MDHTQGSVGRASLPKQGPQGQIRPAAGLFKACKLRMVFTFISVPQKIKSKLYFSSIVLDGQKIEPSVQRVLCK